VNYLVKEGHVSLEDLNVEFGYSTGPGSLFFYTEEENAFRQEVRKYVRDRIAPLAPQIERENNIKLVIKMVKEMGEPGYLGFAFPEEFGGGGKGVVHRTIFTEELTAASYAVSLVRTGSVALFGIPVLNFGSQEQKEKYLKPLIQGTKIGALGITEPTAGSDAIGGMRTRAVKKDDHYIINGEKRYITNGSIADYILLYTITNPDISRRKGMSAFILPTDVPGFEVVKDYELMGRRGTVNSQLRLNNIELPTENLIGEEGQGFEILLHGLNSERICTAAQYIGIARSSFEIATKFAAERQQFGKALREFQGISFRIADMYTNIDATRLLILKAARMADAGLRFVKEAAAAKCFAAEKCTKICDEAMQVLGGSGYTKEYPLEQNYRDIRISRVSAGSTEMLRLTIQGQIYRDLYPRK